MLRQQIAHAIADHLVAADIDWHALELFDQPALRIEATLHDATSTTAAPQTRRQRQAQPVLSVRCLPPAQLVCPELTGSRHSMSST